MRCSRHGDETPRPRTAGDISPEVGICYIGVGSLIRSVGFEFDNPSLVHLITDRPGQRTQMKREYPDHPIAGVGGVVIDRNRVLLIRRGGEPLKGAWSIPGGLLELGEEMAEGVRRELKEETGLNVEPLEVLTVFDRITRDGARVRYHYVIVDYVCRRRGGRLKAGSDVLDARWVRREDLPQYQLTEKATAVVLQAFEYFRKPKPGELKRKDQRVSRTLIRRRDSF